MCEIHFIPSFSTEPYHTPQFSLYSGADSKSRISSLSYSWLYLLAEWCGSSDSSTRTIKSLLTLEEFKKKKIPFTSLVFICYYAIVSPLSPLDLLWIIPSGKHSKCVLHKMIWRTRIITPSPWASDRTSVNPTEARGTCVREGFSLSSLLTVNGRKSQKWAWDMKLSGGYGALELLSQCIQALAGTVLLRGCCLSPSPSPSAIPAQHP